MPSRTFHITFGHTKIFKLGFKKMSIFLRRVSEAVDNGDTLDFWNFIQCVSCKRSLNKFRADFLSGVK